MLNTSSLRRSLSFLTEAPSLDLIYCDALYFGDEQLADAAHSASWRKAGTTCMGGSPSHGPVTFESLLTEQCCVITSSTIARRQRIIECGLFNEGMYRAEDFHLWLRVAYHGGEMGYHTAVLGGHRLRSGSLATTVIKSHEAVLIALRDILAAADLSPERRSLVQRQIERHEALVDLHQGKSYLAAGELNEARHSLARANVFFRSPKLTVLVADLRFAPRLSSKAWRSLVLRKR